MTEPPRRLPPTQEERLRVITRRMAAGSFDGQTRNARPIVNTPPRSATGGWVEIVFHGDDGTVERPSAAWVIWIGAATPSNALDYDGWYTATVA